MNQLLKGKPQYSCRTNFEKLFSSHVNLRQLTILSDKSNAAVDDDGDAIFGQLLVTERLAIRAGGQRDCRVPQCKVHPVEAMDINCSIDEEKNKTINEAHALPQQYGWLIFYVQKLFHVLGKSTAKSLSKQPARLKKNRKRFYGTHIYKQPVLSHEV